MKNLPLLLSMSLLTINAFCQNDPSNEILVFFSTGIEQYSSLKDGQESVSLKVTEPTLKDNLDKIGIDLSMISIALPSFRQFDSIITNSEGEKISQPDMSKLYKIKLYSPQNKESMINKLKELPQVVYAESNGIAAPNVIPNDTDFGELWGLNNVLHVGSDIHIVAAWDIYTGNPNNIIAILDGGVTTSNSEFDNKLVGGDSGYGWDGHGFHVAGIAAANTNNRQGISGVDWNAKIHPQRVDNVDIAGTYQAVVDAVNYSTNVKVLNSSWFLISGYDYLGRPLAGPYSTTIALAFAYAYKANRTLVSTMGNNEEYQPGVVCYPGGLSNVISVGASNNTDHIASFSGTGDHIDVVAPGVDIYSTLPDNTYDSWPGTSMAAPYVSGLSSLLIGYNSALYNDDITNIIRLSADDINYPNDPQIGLGFDVKSGYGRINALRAINLLRTPNSLSIRNELICTFVEIQNVCKQIILFS